MRLARDQMAAVAKEMAEEGFPLEGCPELLQSIDNLIAAVEEEDGDSDEEDD